MSEEFVPKNKQQAEGFKIGRSFVQGFTDQIKEKDTEIYRIKSENENLRLLIDFMEGRGKETQEEITRIRRKIQREQEAIK